MSDIREITTEELVTWIRRAREGDRPALERLFELFAPRVGVIAGVRFGWKVEELEDHEDIAQDALLRAFRSLDGFDVDAPDVSVGGFVGFLATCVQTAIIDYRRGEGAKKRQPATGAHRVRLGDLSSRFFPADGHGHPSARAHHEERGRAVYEALCALEERHQDVLIAHLLEGRSLREMARAGYGSAATAKRIVDRAVARLREELARRYEG